MVRIASASNSTRQSALTEGSPSTKIRISIANDAALEPTERKAVIGVGAPSYTSGAHSPMPKSWDTIGVPGRSSVSSFASFGADGGGNSFLDAILETNLTGTLRAAQVFGRPTFVWDNTPVNDFPPTAEARVPDP